MEILLKNIVITHKPWLCKQTKSFTDIEIFKSTFKYNAGRCGVLSLPSGLPADSSIDKWNYKMYSIGGYIKETKEKVVILWCENWPTLSIILPVTEVVKYFRNTCPSKFDVQYIMNKIK